LRQILVYPPVRTQDKHGSGAYKARRGGREHEGIDFAVTANSKIGVMTPGIVTKVGYPYNPNDTKKGYLRYVQVTDAQGYDTRYFYVSPTVQVRDTVQTGGIIGEAQSLQTPYPGITDHIHFEVKKDGEFINPWNYIYENLYI